MTSVRRPFQLRFRLADIGATARVVLLAGFVEVAIRLMPLDRLARRLRVRLAAYEQDVDHGMPHDAGPARDLSMPERTACRAIARVMRRWPGGSGTCLREALLYGNVLRDHNPLLHIGAGSDGNGVLAHAWLSFEGGTLGQRAGIVELGRKG